MLMLISNVLTETIRHWNVFLGSGHVYLSLNVFSIPTTHSVILGISLRQSTEPHLAGFKDIDHRFFLHLNSILVSAPDEQPRRFKMTPKCIFHISHNIYQWSLWQKFRTRPSALQTRWLRLIATYRTRSVLPPQEFKVVQYCLDCLLTFI